MMKQTSSFLAFASFVIALAVFTIGVQGAGTTVVTPNDLALPPDAVTPQSSWYFYDDTSNVASTIEAPGSYEFVTGVDTPPSGVGSIEFNVATGERWNIATNQFAGMSLTDLGDMAFTIYRPSSSTGDDQTTLFFNIDVDFDDTIANGYQGRLVYVPRENGTVSEDAWQTWDMTDPDARWWWSRYASNGSMWPDGDTTEYRTWADIMSSFPDAGVLHESFTGQMLVRAGHPGPDGLIGYADSVMVAGETYDFEPALTATDKDACKKGGWQTFNAPSFKNQGECVSFVASQGKSTSNHGHTK